jgi:hypothetical protein
MIAAQSRMMTMAPNSPWMMLRINRSFRSLTTGNSPAFTGFRVTMKIVGRALLKEKHPQQSDHEKEARREPKHSAPS